MEYEEIKNLLIEVKELLIAQKEEKILMQLDEASKKLGIGKNRLTNLVKEHRDFPAIKNGSKWLIKMDKVGEWLDKHNRLKIN